MVKHLIAATALAAVVFPLPELPVNPSRSSRATEGMGEMVPGVMWSAGKAVPPVLVAGKGG